MLRRRANRDCRDDNSHFPYDPIREHCPVRGRAMGSFHRVVAGTTLAGYRVIGLAGRGGTGEVYRARDERLSRDVALKLLSADFAADADFRARLVRESQ